MNVDDIVKTACEKETLIEALAYAALIECERALQQRINNPGSGSNGQLYDTCFKHLFTKVFNQYDK